MPGQHRRPRRKKRSKRATKTSPTASPTSKLKRRTGGLMPRKPRNY